MRGQTAWLLRNHGADSAELPLHIAGTYTVDSTAQRTFTFQIRVRASGHNIVVEGSVYTAVMVLQEVRP